MFISVRAGICSGARRTVVCESQLAKMRVLLDYAAVKKGGAQGVRMIWSSIVKEGRWARVLDAGTGRGHWTRALDAGKAGFRQQARVGGGSR